MSNHSRPQIPSSIQVPELQRGTKVLPLYQQVGGNRRYPHTLQYALVAYAVVDEEDNATQSRHRWFAHWQQGMNRHRAERCEQIGNKEVMVSLHREALQLPRNPGRGSNRRALFINGNALDCRKSNLRTGDYEAVRVSSRRRHTANNRFRGTKERVENGKHYGWRAYFTHYYRLYQFPILKGPQAEVHCAYLFNCCGDRHRDRYAQGNVIPPEEMPSPKDQEKLRQIATTVLTQKGLLDANWNLARPTNNHSEPGGREGYMPTPTGKTSTANTLTNFQHRPREP
jgi:hypothetical protein